MKKFVSILLVLAMILSLSLTALAANVTIGTETNREYNGYQLLKLTTSLKTGEHPTPCDGTNHTNACYNFAYTVNEKYRAILQTETFAKGDVSLWDGGTKPDTFAGITDDQILKHLANQTSDNGTEYRTMREVADRLYRAIVAASIVADAKDLDGGTSAAVAQGYWMFADVTDLPANAEAANSLVMVDTKGQSDLTVTPKVALPTLEKKVQDINDSEDNNIRDNAWADTADHDIGDTVPFKLTGTLPSNAQYYTSYKMIFHDTLPAGLTFDSTSVKVYMYESKDKADEDTDLNGGTDVTGSFTLTTTGLANDETFTVGCDNVFGITDVTKDTAFVVYYKATLNEGAAIGGAGNTNEAYLEFSNNPYGTDTDTGTTKTDKVTVYTYKLVINKTDSSNAPLKGAGFTLYKKNTSDTYVAIGDELKGADMTTFTWTGLDDGDYKLVESTVPEGYNKLSDIQFSITAAHTTGLDSLDGGFMGTGVVDTGTITKAIVNNTGTVLPETGAEGTMMLIFGGSLLVIMAAIFMITRKKMSVYED